MKSSGHKNSNADYSLNGESVDMFRVLFSRCNFYASAFVGRFALRRPTFLMPQLRHHMARFSARIGDAIRAGARAFPRTSGRRSSGAAFAQRMDLCTSPRS